MAMPACLHIQTYGWCEMLPNLRKKGTANFVVTLWICVQKGLNHCVVHAKLKNNSCLLLSLDKINITPKLNDLYLSG